MTDFNSNDCYEEEDVFDRLTKLELFWLVVGSMLCVVVSAVLHHAYTSFCWLKRSAGKALKLLSLSRG